jgi:hypothetical protein
MVMPVMRDEDRSAGAIALDAPFVSRSLRVQVLK